MTSKVYTKYIKDFADNDYELHLCKHSDARYDIYASVKNSGNKYHVFGGHVSDLNAWIDGEKWWEVVAEYMEENDIFTDILENDCALQGLTEIQLMRSADINYYADMMKAFHEIQHGDYDPALKRTLRVIIDYFL